MLSRRKIFSILLGILVLIRLVAKKKPKEYFFKITGIDFVHISASYFFNINIVCDVICKEDLSLSGKHIYFFTKVSYEQILNTPWLHKLQIGDTLELSVLNSFTVERNA